ncbi:MAG: hypothetical protein QF371_04430, partial [Flavobacteriales bacterium]|nr:hypothetical protein [Flavobacteriales bacterium]
FRPMVKHLGSHSIDIKLNTMSKRTDRKPSFNLRLGKTPKIGMATQEFELTNNKSLTQAEFCQKTIDQ